MNHQGQVGRYYGDDGAIKHEGGINTDTLSDEMCQEEKQEEVQQAAGKYEGGEREEVKL